MKPSTILASVLPALALASPAKLHAVPLERANIFDGILGSLGVPSIPLQVIADLQRCLKINDNFEVDFIEAEGVFSISHLDRTCCEQGKAIWSQLPEGEYGNAVFSEPCEGVTVTGVSPYNIRRLHEFFDTVYEG